MKDKVCCSWCGKKYTPQTYLKMGLCSSCEMDHRTALSWNETDKNGKTRQEKSI